MLRYFVYLYASSLFVHCYSEEVNYALGRPARQSSTEWGGFASRAADGNGNTNFFADSCTHTDSEDTPWWSVDLQRPRLVTAFEITNRGDEASAGARLFDFVVEIGYNNRSVGENEVCYFYNGTVSEGGIEYLQCERPVFGRFVFVKKTRHPIDPYFNILTICEMRVYGQEFIPRSGYGRRVEEGLTYRGDATFSVGDVKNAMACMFACLRHPGCISYIVTATATGDYICEINDSEDTSLQTPSEGARCYLFEPTE